MESTGAHAEIPPPELLIDQEQARQRLKMSPATIARTRTANPPLRWYRMGHRWYTTEADIAEWVEARSNRPAPHPGQASLRDVGYRRRVELATREAEALMRAR